MTKEEFIKEFNSYFPQSMLGAVKLVKDVSNLGLKESKDLVDNHWAIYNKAQGERVAELLERKYNIVFQNIKIVDKNSLTIAFSKLQIEAKTAGLEKHFEYLCESMIDNEVPVIMQHISKLEDKRSDEVRH